MNSILPALALSDWAPSFDSVSGVFCAIAWFSTALAVILTVISLFAEIGGGDADIHSGDTDTSGGDTGIFSLRAIIGFFLGFGWAGYVVAQSGGSVWAALGASLLTGLVMFGIVAAIIRGICGLKSEVVLDYRALIGKTGTVYVTVPPSGAVGGQVQIAADQLLTLPAVQTGDTPLAAATSVRVTAVSGAVLTVEPL